MGRATFPPLEPSDRSREFNYYTEKQRGAVVYYWLFTNYGFREIDDVVLGKDHYQGFQSMGIAHFLGLTKIHKAFFLNSSIDNALEVLLPYTANNPRMMLIYCYIRDYGTQTGVISDSGSSSYAFKTDALESFCWTDEILLHKIVSDSLIDNRLMLMQNRVNAEKHEITINRSSYRYSSQTLKETLKYLYDFRCTVCGSTIYHLGWSESLSRKNQWNFLSADVHHIIPLSKGGPDSYENMICLCPNCHRKFHTGEYELREKGSDIICKDQVLGDALQIKPKHTIHLL